MHRAIVPLGKSALIWFVCMGELVFKGIGGQCPTPVTILIGETPSLLASPLLPKGEASAKGEDCTGYPTENRCRILDAQIWRQFRIISISH
ncbi:hypothetical protein [Nostoc sp.]|uniref:hypothetical protein n=1 Tax=Nostoc sp. TaxID=1180 RepID=UPI002FF9F082